MSARRSGYRRRKKRSSGLNLLIAVNKPYGKVTRAVDNYVANALGDDGVGHIGTLDPAVTGVVVLAVGQAKKLISSIEDGRQKSYSAAIAFGFETNTDDADGTAIRSAAVPERLYEREYAAGIISSLVGEQRQRPPRYSAIKVNGVRAYDLARAGEDFELPERDVHIYDATLTGIDTTDGLRWNCDFTVSPGTYIRSLARDIGRMTGSAAHLGALCRTAAGFVTLDDCVCMEQVAELGAEGVRAVALDPTAVLGLPTYTLNDEELEHARNGRTIEMRPETCGHGTSRVSLVHQDRLYGVWNVVDGALRPQVNCPLGVEGVRA